MRTVYLLRHGQPQGAGVSRCLGGRSDPPLSPEGIRACAQLAPALARLNVQTLGCSPLRRCRETAALLFPGLEPVCLPGLAELDCGDWDGLPFSEIRARWPEHYARRGRDPSLPPPGGETLDQAAARARAALAALLAETEGDLALVAHSGLNRALLCALTGLPFARYREIPQPYLCINLLRWDGAALRVEAAGLDGSPNHLEQLESEEVSHEKPV